MFQKLPHLSPIFSSVGDCLPVSAIPQFLSLQFLSSQPYSVLTTLLFPTVYDLPRISSYTKVRGGKSIL